MKAYISGAISNRPREVVERDFKLAEEQLRAKGYEPVNPLNNNLSDNASWLDHMREDIKMMLNCDIVYMLVGWPDSKGAIIEKQLAENLGLKVMLQKP